MKKFVRPAIFKWRLTEPQLVLSAVHCYLRYSLSLRDVEELLLERGLEADPHHHRALDTVLWSRIRARLRRCIKPTNKSWRVDETYVRVKGRWCYYNVPKLIRIMKMFWLRSIMATGRPKTLLTVTDGERIQLSSLARSCTLPHAWVARAKLVLWSANGQSNSQIAARLSWTKATVGKWHRRFLQTD